MMLPPISSILLLLIPAVVAQDTPTIENNTNSAFRPSLLIVMAVFAIMFSLTFLLLMYAKFCNLAAELFGPSSVLPITTQMSAPRASGVDKTVIESLPFFQFASLKGARDGLECSVCLAAFEDAELLRLLPKCKHAFHVDCVDRWLEDHASCPLCRHRVAAEDAYSAHSSFRHPVAEDNSRELEVSLFVEREPSFRHNSARFSTTKKVNEMQDSLLPNDGSELLHKFKHRIIISDVMFNGRWSDVNSADLVSLNTDMLGVVSSKRFDAIDMASGSGMRSIVQPRTRCMSEITSVSRLSTREENGGGRGRKEWLPMAKKTVQWFAGKERGVQSLYRREDGTV